MSNNSKRAEGKGEEIVGGVQKAVGKVLGDQDLAARGQAHQDVGRTKQAAAKTAETVKGAVEQVVGSVKGAVGDLIDNGEMHANGKAQEAKGKARQAFNK